MAKLPNGSPPTPPSGFGTNPNIPNNPKGVGSRNPYNVPNVRVNTLDLDQFQLVNDAKLAPQQQIFSSKSVFDNLPDDQIDALIDQNWVQKAFLTGDIYLEPLDQANRYYTSAALKFTNSTLGGNFGVNARPQFTRYADIRVPGRFPGAATQVTIGTKDNMGMGRYYSEAIDNNSEIIYMRFGVPAFNSLLNFFTGFYNAEDAMLANTGRISKLYEIAKGLTSVAFFVYFPLLSVMIYGKDMLEAFFGTKSNQYYYLKPTMHTYWAAVNTLVNVIATNLNLLPPQLTNTKSQAIGTPYTIPQSYLKALHAAMPEVFNAEWGIDAFAIANKPQRLANMAYEYQYKMYKTLTTAQSHYGFATGQQLEGKHTTYAELIQLVEIGDYNVGATNTSVPVSTQKKGQKHDFYSYIQKAFATPYYKGTKQTANTGMPPSEIVPLVNTKTAKGQTYKEAQQDMDSFGNFLEADWDDGAAFAVFRVNFTGAGTLSYSHTVGQTGIAEKYNSYASKVRSYKFDTEDLTTGLTGGALGAVMGWAGDAANGVMSALHIDGIANMVLGNVKLEVPDYWEDVSVNFPTSNYEMELVSPYGNVISQIQNIYLPLSMILAGSLPLAAGKASYTAPFICSLFDRGHNQMQLGIIDSVSVEYGTTNLPFTRWGRPLGVNVSFSVTNLTKIMSIPLAAGTLFGTGDNYFTNMNQDSPIANFIAIITGRDLYSQIYAMPAAQLKLGETIKQFYSFTEPARWAGYLHQTLTTGALSWTMFPNILGALNNGLATPTQGTSSVQKDYATAANT